MPLPELREALRFLSRDHGWSYSALWRPDRSDFRMLMMDECYYEEQVRTVVDKMRNQVHMAGEGSIGAIAGSGKHQWIDYDNCCIDPSLSTAGDKLDLFQGDADLRQQFFVGIKTIAIVSVQPFGVVQFGSSEKISENLKFVNQVQYIFEHLGTMTGLFQNVDAPQAMNTHDSHAVFTSLMSCGDTYSSNINISTLHQNACKFQLALAESSTDPTQPSSLFSRGCHNGNIYHGGSMNHCVLPMQAASHTTDMLAKDITTLTMMEPRLLSGMTLQGFSSMLPTKSHFSIPRANIFRCFSGGSSESCSPYGLQGDQSTQNPLSNELPFASDLPDNIFSFPQDKSLEHSQPVHYKDDPFNDLILLGNQQLDQLNDVLTESMDDDLLNISCVSSVLVGGDSASCSQTAELPSKQVQNSSSCVKNSCDTHYVPNLLQADNDLFDGLDFDLNPKILGQDPWEDVVLPLSGDSCSNFTTNVPESINMGSTEDSDKGFFLESTLEQLLDAVVAGTVNFSSSHSSAPSNSSSVACLDSELPVPKATKAGVPPQVCRNQNSSPKETFSKSHVRSWIDDSCSMNAESSVINKPKKPEETAKVARKRARPGESTRPRPKDRQQIQDRVKELREIVPNGAKCSIDSLLDRTIKHMLFLQSVTKYADKLRQADEPKMIGDRSGVVLKDHLSSGGGGATWAYEVAGQTMVCPIFVEDLNPPGQMLVEILCEDRGFFHEIADIIRGFGLTILKGVMEIRDGKIWARFLVEANRDVTRMEIFLSLIKLLQ